MAESARFGAVQADFTDRAIAAASAPQPRSYGYYAILCRAIAQSDLTSREARFAIYRRSRSALAAEFAKLPRAIAAASKPTQQNELEQAIQRIEASLDSYPATNGMTEEALANMLARPGDRQPQMLDAARLRLLSRKVDFDAVFPAADLRNAVTAGAAARTVPPAREPQAATPAPAQPAPAQPTALPSAAPAQPPIATAPPRPVAPARNAGVGNMIAGAVWCGGGSLVTYLTYNAAVSGGGGHYFIAWGAILFGGIQFLKGLLQWLGDLSS